MARKPADQSVDREDILWAAAEVLRRKGYDATTMKDIAAQVNLTAAVISSFQNKDFLLLSVLEVGLDLATKGWNASSTRICPAPTSSLP